MTHAAELIQDMHDAVSQDVASEDGDQQQNENTWSGYVRERPPFHSGGQGSRIRDALTGEYTDHLVGSRHERLYYKVCDASNIFNKSRGKLAKSGALRESSCYFFASPQEYMKHRRVDLSVQAINDWTERRNAVHV